MNAQQMFLKVGDEYHGTSAWMCSACRRVITTLDPLNAQEVANDCCLPRVCDKHGECDRNEYCAPCAEEKRRAAMEAILERATLVEDYDGWVYDWIGDGTDNGFFESVEEFREDWEENCIDGETGKPYEMPEFVFCCTPRPFVIGIDDLIDLVDRKYDSEESIVPSLRGVSELAKALAQFNEANKDIFFYDEDYTRKVRVR